ncbi:MAG: hypothetical protein V2I46_06535 [Bacteroides sp.]|nr:hypothetical protein [Bacteroides sp.]
MNQQQRKPDFGFTYIALGLVIGFFIGAGIVYWYTNRQNDSVFAHNLWNYFAKIFQDDKQAGSYQVSEEFPRASGPYKPEQNAEQTTLSDTISLKGMADSLAKDPLTPDTLTEALDEIHLAELLAKVDAEEGQTLMEGTIAETTSNMRLAKDSLLGIRAYSLPTQGPVTPKDPSISQLDSLLGNYTRKGKPENMMIVEFWLSPLNYQGYKMSHNKIVFYGLDQLESFSLHTDGSSYYIKYLEDYYPLSMTLDFKPLIPSNEVELLEETQERWH